MIEVKTYNNFLDNPEYYINLADRCKFYTHDEHEKIVQRPEGWAGLRTLDLKKKMPELVHKLNSTFDIKVGRLNFYQHPMSTFANAPEGKDHIDAAWQFSGVIYLKGSDGTVVGGERYPYVFNRCLCFDAHTPHHPLFGSSDRLVITFFSHFA